MKIFEEIKILFEPPSFEEEEEKTRRVKVLYAVTLNLIVVLSLALIVGDLFFFVEKVITNIALAFILTILAVVFFLTRQGNVISASLLMCITLEVVICILVIISGGIRSVDLMLFISTTVLTGLLFGKKGIRITTIFPIIFVFVLAILEKSGVVFPSVFKFPPIVIWLIFLISISSISLPLAITLGSLSGALEHARNQINERRIAEETARRRAEEMSLLYQMGISLASGNDLYSTLYALQTEIIKLIRADAFYVAIYDASTDIVSYPIFFDEGSPLQGYSRKLSQKPGLTGVVIFNGQTLYLADMMDRQIVAQYAPVDDNDLILHTFLGVPLVSNENVIGMLSVQSKQIDAYSPEQIKLVESLAVQAAIAIDKARLLEQIQNELAERKRAEETVRQRANEFALLYDMSMAISAGRDLDHVMRSLLEYSKRLFDVNTFYFGIYDDVTGIIQFSLFWNEGEFLYTEPRNLREVPGLSGEVIFGRKTTYFPDLMEPAILQRALTVSSMQERNKSFLGIPLLAQDEVIGMISMQSQKTDAYSPEQIRLFETIASQTSIAIEKARLLDQYRNELTERKRIEEDLRLERDQLEHRRKIMEHVIELGKRVAQVTDLRSCLLESYNCIHDELGFDRVGLFLYDPENKSVRGAYGTNRAGETVEMFSYSEPIAQTKGWQDVLNDPHGLVIVENYQETRHIEEDDEMFGVKQHATIAAWAGDAPIALISVDNVLTQRPFTSEQIEGVRLLAGYIGLAINNARLNDELENRVQERTAQLEIAMNELESFSYSVAHDLRSPLRAMRGFSQMVKDDEYSGLSRDSIEKLNRIASAAQTMGELIDALLDFSRLTRATIKPIPLDLSSIAYYAISNIMKRDTARQVDVEIEENLMALGDSRLVQIVIENLLSNAWKFTAKTSHAKIKFGKIEQNGESVFFIRDNGAGFNMEYADKLFGAFQRLHHPDEFPGHGAGLAIVQRIIHRHGGKIWAEGKVNEGATFYFTLGQEGLVQQ